MMHNFEEISMWKKIIICSFIIAIILIFICIKISIPDNSDNIIIGVKDIIITNITETNPTYETIFNVYDWDDELREEVRKEMCIRDRKYINIEELTAPLLNELIEKIVVHDPKEVDGVRTQKVEIFYRFIGILNE